MSRAERLLLQRLNRRAAQLEPALARELLDAFEAIRRALSPADLGRLIGTESVERLLSETLTDELLEQELSGFRAELQNVLREATRMMASDVPGMVSSAIRESNIAFNVLNPNVIEAIRALDTRVMTTLKASIRETVRQTVETGLSDGAGPRAIARQIRDSVGIAPHQQKAIDGFRRALEGGPRSAVWQKAFDYKLRDRRFDRTLARAIEARQGLTPDQINRMVAAYERRMLAHHAETVARTAAIDALKAGHRLNWEQAIERGVVERARMRKRWSDSRDSKVRPTHRKMHGEVVHFDETFSNGQMIPGDDEFGCRCLAIYYQVAAERAEAA